MENLLPASFLIDIHRGLEYTNHLMSAGIQNQRTKFPTGAPEMQENAKINE